MKRFTIQGLAAIAVAATMFSGAALAQKAAPTAPVKAPVAQPVSAPAAPALAVPPPEQLVAIIRSTVMAVNHGNLTNNYSVLRDLGSPDFKASQTQETLSKSFEGFRNAKIDAGITAAVIPQLTKPPSLDDKGILRLTGYYPTRPRVVFDMAFQQIGDRWQHVGIAMGTAQAPPAPVAQAPTAQQDTSQITTSSTKPAAAKKK